ncbi:MAG: nuclear transport factor 2 family protein [Acidimicrobiia bacterium]
MAGDDAQVHSDERLPKAMVEYLAMWNSDDLEEADRHMELAVSDDVVFADPRDFHMGKESLVKNVRRFKRAFPDAVLGLRSGVDGQHNRFRYEWRISSGETVILDGFDVTTLNDDGLIERIDGFFGELPAKGDFRSA